MLLFWSYGAQDYVALRPACSAERWGRTLTLAKDLLRARGWEHAADVLSSHKWELSEATNGFGDEFHVLHLNVPVDSYVKWEAVRGDHEQRSEFREIAKAVTELGFPLRLIAVEIVEEKELAPVPAPDLRITSEFVERALNDAVQLVATQGATSAVDRVHTALHAYLKAACEEAGIITDKDAGLTATFKLVRAKHPAFSTASSHEEHVQRILNAMAVILDALNPLRNRGSVAHPSKDLVAEPEAMLIINCVRTALHYLDSKLHLGQNGF